MIHKSHKKGLPSGIWVFLGSLRLDHIRRLFRCNLAWASKWRQNLEDTLSVVRWGILSLPGP
jgi:hypothetical protein